MSSSLLRQRSSQTSPSKKQIKHLLKRGMAGTRIGEVIEVIPMGPFGFRSLAFFLLAFRMMMIHSIHQWIPSIMFTFFLGHSDARFALLAGSWDLWVVCLLWVQNLGTFLLLFQRKERVIFGQLKVWLKTNWMFAFFHFFLYSGKENILWKLFSVLIFMLILCSCYSSFAGLFLNDNESEIPENQIKFTFFMEQRTHDGKMDGREEARKVFKINTWKLEIREFSLESKIVKIFLKFAKVHEKWRERVGNSVF